MSLLPRSRQILGLAMSVALALVAAGFGAVASVEAASFYATLARPAWAPPAWLFGPAWSFLYLSMAFAAWLVWRDGGLAARRVPLALYLAQLAVNALWSWLFFAWHLGGVACGDIAVLWVLITATLLGFWRVRPLAGALLVPYLAWVTFAAALCYRTWKLNPAVFS